MSDTATNPVDSVQAAADAAHDGITAAERWAIRCVHRIQERPVQSVIYAMFSGVLVGLWLRR